MNHLADPAERQLARAHRRWADATRSFIEFPRDALERSVPERIEHAVELHGERVAVKFGDQSLTYTAVNQLANRLANTLITRLGARNEPVALLLESGVAPVVATLGTLKAGKILVALDPAHPSTRLNAILEDSQARLIVTNRRHLGLVDECGKLQATAPRPIDIVLLDELGDTISGENPGLAISPDAHAVIFYTSGTTGQPKGVIHSHRNLLHRTMVLTNAFRIGCDDREPQFLSYTVARSLSILDMLMNGGTILPHDLKAIGAAHLAEWLTENQITILPMTSGLFRQLAETLPEADEHRFPQVRLVIMSGEPISRQEILLWQQHFAPNSVLVYSMGSSEAMRVAHLFFDKDLPIPHGTIPIGYPSEGKDIALVDDNGLPVEPGQVGEIAIRSRYLSPGYWRKPALTERVFRPDPEGGDNRLFFSGDLARVQEDGALEFVGRRDFQVKVRGHTVQLSEVEMALLDAVNVRETVVIAQPGRGGDLRLIAYLAAKTQPAPTVHELRAALKEKLPPHMIPSAFVYLDALPRGLGGKVDRKALPPPGRGRPGLARPFVPPRTELEARIAGVWAEVLELDEVGIHDDFFELGGDSLSAMQMILEIERLAGQMMPPDYFRAPTIAALARRCESGTLPVESSPRAVTHQPETAPNPSRRRLDRLFAGQITANAILRRAIRDRVMRLPHEQGLRWLAWVGQPGIANRLFRDERELFRRLAQDLGDPAAASDDAFRASVIGNIIWLCHQQRWSSTQRPPGDLVEAMHSAPDRFWRSFAHRVDHASGEERGRLVRFTGLENLYHAQKPGRGTILLTYHSPAAPFANAILSRYTSLGHIQTISQESAHEMAERELPADKATFDRRQAGWSATFALQGQRILKAGGVVQIVNDMSYDEGNCLRKCVGGRWYDLKPGFAELALATGAAVLPVYCAFDSVGQVRMTILPALGPLADAAAHPARVHHLLDQYVAFLENAWRRAPESLGWGALRRYYSRPLVITNDRLSPISPA